MAKEKRGFKQSRGDSLMEELDKKLDRQGYSRSQDDTGYKGSPPEQGLKVKRRKPERRISSQGIAGFRKAPTDA